MGVGILQRKRHSVVIATAGALVLIVLAAAAILWISHDDAALQIPSNIRSSAHFPLYISAHPPQGFTLDKQSFSSTSQVVIFSYSYNRTAKVVVSIQASQKDIDPDRFNPTATFNTPIGMAYLAAVSPRVSVAIISSQSFVLVNAESGISTDLMRQFVSSLQKM